MSAEKVDFNLLLFLSDYHPGSQSEEYYLDDELYIGTQTNDAPVRCLIESALKEKKNLKRVICITSYKVMTEPEDKPQYDRFKDYVTELLSEYGNDSVAFCCIPYDFEKDCEDKLVHKDFGKQLPAELYRELSKCFENVTEGEEVYIDYTGGVRDISFLMTSMIRFLEFRGLVCGKIVYSLFRKVKEETNKYKNNIYDIHYIYDLYQLINGVNEFVNTGNAHELEKFYRTIPREDLQGKNTAITMIEKLIDFSNALAICDIGSLDNKVKELDEAIKKVEDYASEGYPSDINFEMLKSLAPIIRKKMYLDSDKEINYPKMIRWCVDNNMIQQAITIYVDKMPKYYFEHNMIPDYVDISQIEPKLGHTKYDEGFYTELYDRAAEGLEVRELYEVIKNSTVSFTDTITKDQAIENLTCEANNIQDKKIRDALLKFVSFVKKYYKDDLKKDPDFAVNIYPRMEYVEERDAVEEKPGDLPSRAVEIWNALKTRSNIYWRHFFLYNNSEDYKAIASPKNNAGYIIYRKKAFAISRLKDGKVQALINGVNYNERTYMIMAYYLAVKILRNRMNHAGEGEQTVDEKEALKLLEKMVGIKLDGTIDSYKKTILDGIQDRYIG